MKMVKLLKELVIGNEEKEQKGKYLSMLFGAVGDSLLGSMLTGKRVIRVGERTVRSRQDVFCCLILWLILKYKNIRTNPDLIVFIQ